VGAGGAPDRADHVGTGGAPGRAGHAPAGGGPDSANPTGAGGAPDSAGHAGRRLPRVGPLASTYVTILGLSATEGLIGGIVSPFLADQGYVPAAIGFLVALEGVVSLLSRLPSGLIYRGRRATTLLRGALAAQVLVAAAYPFATGLLAFGLARAVQGLAFGLGTTVNFAAFMDSLPARQEGGSTAMSGVGVYLAFVSAGFVIGNFLSGFAVDRLGYGAAFGLAALFSLVALPFAVAPPRRAAPPGALAAPRPATPAPPRWPRRGRLPAGASSYLAPDVLAMVLLAFIMLVLYTVVGTFFPLFALGVGLSLSQVGIVRGLQSLANTLTRPFTGELSRRLGYRRVGHVGLLITVLLTSALPLFPHFETYVVVFLLLGLVRGAALVSNSMMAVDLATQRGLSRGVISGVLNAGQDLGGIAGPILGGLLAGPFGVAAALHALPLAVYALYVVVVGGLYLRPRAAARR
jgi:MFS family permease